MRKVLLDENLPHALESELAGCEVWTVRRAGWAGVKNGELLRRANDDFDWSLAERGSKTSVHSFANCTTQSIPSDPDNS